MTPRPPAFIPTPLDDLLMLSQVLPTRTNHLPYPRDIYFYPEGPFQERCQALLRLNAAERKNMEKQE